jgi:serine/threonine-protein kinase
VIAGSALIAIAAGLAIFFVVSRDRPAHHVAKETPAPRPQPQQPQPIIVTPTQVAQPAPTITTIEIVTTPAGAAVRLDDAAAPDPTPAKIETAPGPHQIVVALAGYEPLTRAVNVGAGEHLQLELSLTATPGTTPPARPITSARNDRKIVASRPSTGYLTVKTTPWSDVYADGRKLGTTPLADVELPAGTHVLLFKNPDQKQVRRAVTIRPGATTKLSIRLGE